MSILSDATIRALCTKQFIYEGESPGKPETAIYSGCSPMIKPFVDGQVRTENDNPVISYGLSSYGYDVRIQNEAKLFTNVNGGIVDPMEPDAKHFVVAELYENEKGQEYFIIPPNSYALAATVEEFSIPDNVTVICVGKSTYARSAILINTTPIEAGFCGEVVIEISNGSNLPVKIYPHMGIAQFLFLRGNELCDVTYAHRNGKYQNQKGITHSKV